mmetsp:Transcript_27374/g.59820  ORF Transcript_27374/g.59820 Transcript_27374/m.59820 type:complete len:312 (-) Transcript_27374:2406-3341(-)
MPDRRRLIHDQPPPSVPSRSTSLTLPRPSTLQQQRPRQSMSPYRGALCERRLASPSTRLQIVAPAGPTLSPALRPPRPPPPQRARHAPAAPGLSQASQGAGSGRLGGSGSSQPHRPKRKVLRSKSEGAAPPRAVAHCPLWAVACSERFLRAVSSSILSILSSVLPPPEASSSCRLRFSICSSFAAASSARFAFSASYVSSWRFDFSRSRSVAVSLAALVLVADLASSRSFLRRSVSAAAPPSCSFTLVCSEVTCLVSAAISSTIFSLSLLAPVWSFLARSHSALASATASFSAFSCSSRFFIFCSSSVWPP